MPAGSRNGFECYAHPVLFLKVFLCFENTNNIYFFGPMKLLDKIKKIAILLFSKKSGENGLIHPCLYEKSFKQKAHKNSRGIPVQ